MHAVREVLKKAREKGACRAGAAVAVDLDIDVSRVARSKRDEDIGFLAAKRRQIFEIEMNEAKRLIHIERTGLVLRRLLPLRNAVAHEAAMDGGSRDSFKVHAAAHDLDDVVQRELEGPCAVRRRTAPRSRSG